MSGVVLPTPTDPQRLDGRWDVLYGSSTITAPNKTVAEWHAENLRDVLMADEWCAA